MVERISVAAERSAAGVMPYWDLKSRMKCEGLTKPQAKVTSLTERVLSRSRVLAWPSR